MCVCVCVNLDHKTSHKGLKIWNLRVQKKLNIEKITFKVPNEVLSNAYY